MIGRRLGLIERIILIAGMIAGGAAISGCEEDLAYLGGAGMEINAKTPKQAQAWDIATGLAGEAGRRKHEENVAREGKSEVNVNINNSQAKRDYQDPDRTITIFTCNKMVDMNGDMLIDFDSEVFGLNKRIYNIDTETIECYLHNPTSYRNVRFKSWASDGRLIGETEIFFPDGRPFNGRGTGPSSPEFGDFMDNIRGAGPGIYRITATINDSEKTTVYTHVNVVRNN